MTVPAAPLGDAAAVVRLLSRQLKAPVMLVGPDDLLAWANPAARELFALAPSDGLRFTDFFSGPELDTRLRSGRPFSAIPRSGRQAGQTALFTAHELPDGGSILVLGPDAGQPAAGAVTRADEARDRAEKAETYFNRRLVQQLKNDLALMAAVIRTRSAATRSPAVRSALRAVHQRMSAVALVHELLDDSQTIDVLDAGVILRELAAHLQGTVCPPGVVIEADAVPCTMLVDEATVLCLLVNELVRVLLGAMPRTAPQGRIGIALCRCEGRALSVEISAQGLVQPVAAHTPEIEALRRQFAAEVHELDGASGWRIEVQPKAPTLAG